MLPDKACTGVQHGELQLEHLLQVVQYLKASLTVRCSLRPCHKVSKQWKNPKTLTPTQVKHRLYDTLWNISNHQLQQWGTLKERIHAVSKEQVGRHFCEKIKSHPCPNIRLMSTIRLQNCTAIVQEWNFQGSGEASLRSVSNYNSCLI